MRISRLLGRELPHEQCPVELFFRYAAIFQANDLTEAPLPAAAASDSVFSWRSEEVVCGQVFDMIGFCLYSEDIERVQSDPARDFLIDHVLGLFVPETLASSIEILALRTFDLNSPTDHSHNPSGGYRANST